MNRDDVPKIAVKGRAAGELLELQGQELLRWSWEYQKGYPTSSEGPSSKGAVSDPTFRSAVERDPFLVRGVSFEQWLKRYHEAACALIELAHLLAPIDPKAEERARARQSTVQVCSACGRDVLNTADDRLRKGYCDACRKAWERAGYPDRPAFEQTRRGAA